ncbi:MAG: hypothetical protein H6806_12330 [Planctomycetes bacterium]|nr:hypothetical protein [Planctomycetota bacterium]
MRPLLLGGMALLATCDSGAPFFEAAGVEPRSRVGNLCRNHCRNLLILVTARIVPLEELEPKDNLVLPPEPERFYRPIREIDPGRWPLHERAADVPPPALNLWLRSQKAPG